MFMRSVLLCMLCSVGQVWAAGNKTTLDAGLRWDGVNLQKLKTYVNKNKNKNKTAVFDWDNTVIKNDIGDVTTFYMLRQDKIVKPSTWNGTSRHLSKAAVKSLDQHCPLTQKGTYLLTSKNKACATAILCVYYEAKVWDGKTQLATSGERCSGAKAYQLLPPANGDTIEPGYAWTVALQAGHTPAAIRNIGSTAFSAALSRKIGATQTIGYVRGLNAYIRVYAQIKNLITTLQQHGFNVWVSTASSQYIVDAIAPQHVGVPAERVIGVRAVLNNGKLTSNFQSCGTYAAGQDIINYRQGKRCWLNRIVFSVRNKKQQLQQASPISFGAGDSDTDYFFLRDASDLRLVINRNKREVMCNALQNADSKWIVNKMFIAPKKLRTKGYRCAGFKNVLGKIIPDQKERI